MNLEKIFVTLKKYWRRINLNIVREPQILFEGMEKNLATLKKYLRKNIRDFKKMFANDKFEYCSRTTNIVRGYGKNIRDFRKMFVKKYL
jgi:hypothetical protein